MKVDEHELVRKGMATKGLTMDTDILVTMVSSTVFGSRKGDDEIVSFIRAATCSQLIFDQ